MAAIRFEKRHWRRIRLSIIPAFALLLLAAACFFPGTPVRLKDPAASGKGDLTDVVITSGRQDDIIESGSWLDCTRLFEMTEEVDFRAAQAGYCAEWVQPDYTIDRCFLIVAPDQPAASQLNGFFSWLSDRTGSDSGEPPLLLCLDRLFTDSARPFAAAGGQYSDPKVVGLLEYTLQQILSDDYQPEILSFILDCYRKHFHERLTAADCPVWREHKRFLRIGVTYDASLYNTVSFND